MTRRQPADLGYAVVSLTADDAAVLVSLVGEAAADSADAAVTALGAEVRRIQRGVVASHSEHVSGPYALDTTGQARHPRYRVTDARLDSGALQRLADLVAACDASAQFPAQGFAAVAQRDSLADRLRDAARFAPSEPALVADGGRDADA